MKDMPLSEAVLPPLAREYPGVNWGGLKTLYVREVRRSYRPPSGNRA